MQSNELHPGYFWAYVQESVLRMALLESQNYQACQPHVNTGISRHSDVLIQCIMFLQATYGYAKSHQQVYAADQGDHGSHTMKSKRAHSAQEEFCRKLCTVRCFQFCCQKKSSSGLVLKPIYADTIFQEVTLFLLSKKSICYIIFWCIT